MFLMDVFTLYMAWQISVEREEIFTVYILSMF